MKKVNEKVVTQKPVETFAMAETDEKIKDEVGIFLNKSAYI